MKITPLVSRIVLLCSLFVPLGGIRAELGSDSPAGISGQFNGNVTTGGSYDPYTGNATRSITDLVVPGAVGAYPLAFTRTINTRTKAFGSPGLGEAEFGKAGAWRHSYQWTINQSYILTPTGDSTVMPDKYIVYYPDGGAITFVPSEATKLQPWKSSVPGIGDRFVPMLAGPATDKDCYLLLTDGGKIHFTVVVDDETIDPNTSPDPEQGGETEAFTKHMQWDYSLAEIIDPYGQVTKITGAIDATGNFRVTKIQEPGPDETKRRELSITYVSRKFGTKFLKYIQSVVERPYASAAAGRTVTYNYPLPDLGITQLDSVDYYGDSSLQARYTYQPKNDTNANSPPLIATCDDSMFEGPMSKIRYTFVSSEDYGRLESEKSYSSVPALDGIAVSTLEVTSSTTRKETRGDGPSRTFTYLGGLLKSWTDFNAIASSQEHTAGFVQLSKDGRMNQTDFLPDSVTGKVKSITYPHTPSDSGSDRGNVIIEYSAGTSLYHVVKTTDERSKVTTYGRDGTTYEVNDINYPDSSHEGFHYNSRGQVEWHQRKNGFYEHFEYDDRGRLIHAWNPVVGNVRPSGSEPKTTISYYQPGVGEPWQDRVFQVTDARQNVTTYEYEVSSTGAHLQGRGLVSKVTFPGTKYWTFVYNRTGHVTREENELRQPREVGYDEYNRVFQVKTARPSAGDPAIQDGTNLWAITVYDYTPPGHSPMSLTTAAATTVTSAENVVVDNLYDSNLRLKTITQQNPPSGPASVTEVGYDLAGNQQSVIDPNLHETTRNFDERNRRSKVTTPPVDVFGAVGKVALVTEFFYDPASNIRLIIQPDLQQRIKTYDPLNRLESDTIVMSPANRVSNYTYFPSGKLKSLSDPKSQLTQFEYDERDLPKKLTYPDTTVVVGWKFDEMANMTERPTVGGPKQLFGYDTRNRLTSMRWSNAIDFSDFGYDDANRLNYARNPYSTIARLYDVAGRLSYDDQTIAGVSNTLTPVIVPTSVVSRKVHSISGAFDIVLPLSGPIGIESRSGGSSNDYTLVLNFATAVTAAGANVNSGIGTVTGPVTASGTTLTVNLTGVSNAQRLTVKVFGVSDGTNVGEITIPMHVLVGDVTANGAVDADDRELTKGLSGSVVSSSNFRADVNCNSEINLADVAIVRAGLGTSSTTPIAGPVKRVSYGYNLDGKRSHLSVAGTTYDYSFRYDGMGRFKDITQLTNPVAVLPDYEYVYDKASNVLSRNNGLNLTSQVYTFDEVNRMSSRVINANVWDSAEPPAGYAYEFSHETYGYDKMSRLRSTDRDEDQKRDAFGYNGAGELTSADYGLQKSGTTYVGPATRAVTYALDKAGNREGSFGISETVAGSTTAITFTPNNLNQYAETTNGTQHEISGYNSVTYNYLANTYLASVSAVGKSTYQLGYDALGRCVNRTTGGVPSYYVYDGAHSIIEYGSTNVIHSQNVYGLGIDEIILHDDNGTPIYLQQDRLGNTSAVTDAGGAVIEQYRYDAFGAPEIRSGPTAGTGLPVQNWHGTSRGVTGTNNRFLFTGREWVQPYGFYEYRARAFSPALGRFMSEDPIGFAAGDANLFRYGGGDPVNRTDPSGLIDKKPPGPCEHGDCTDANVGYGGPTGNNGAYAGGSLDDPSNYGLDPSSGQGDRVGVNLGGMDPFTPGWHDTSNFGPNNGQGANNHVGGPSGYGSNGGGNGARRGSPSLLEFLRKPPTPAQVTWTERGKWPTLIGTGIIFGIPELVAALPTVIESKKTLDILRFVIEAALNKQMGPKGPLGPVPLPRPVPPSIEEPYIPWNPGP